MPSCQRVHGSVQGVFLLVMFGILGTNVVVRAWVPVARLRHAATGACSTASSLARNHQIAHCCRADPRRRHGWLTSTSRYQSTSPTHDVISASNSADDTPLQQSPQRHTEDASSTRHDNPTPPIKVPKKFVPFPFSYHQELDVMIEGLSNRGLGIARVPVEQPEKDTDEAQKDDSDDDDDDDNHDVSTTSRKWVIMVPSVIPGERVRIRVYRNFASYSEADLLQVLEPADSRRTPLCPHATSDCGGCQLQHMTLPAQRDWKTSMVSEALTQYQLQDVAPPVQPCLGTDEEFAYRSKLTPHYQQPRRSRRGVDNTVPANRTIDEIGFQCKTSRQLVDITHCPIATPAINTAYQEIRERLLNDPTPRKKGATLFLRQANLEEDYVETNHNNVITTKVNGLSFSYLAGNFFQNNYHVLPLMVDHVIEEATKGGGMTHLADCYCGSGLFAISVASSFEKVVGIEINAKAIAEATANADANGITNCQFLAASAENIFSVLEDFPRSSSVVVIDPPRKGCSPEFLDQLVAFGPARIVYMSCDPTTQARDAAVLVPAGYRITSVIPFDLFPQTRHIECLMILDQAEEGKISHGEI